MPAKQLLSVSVTLCSSCQLWQ